MNKKIRVTSQFLSTNLIRFSSLNLREYDWLISPLVIFIITRLALFLAAYYGDIMLPSDTAAQYVIIEPKPPILGLFARWDSEWYIYIAAKGYYYLSNDQSPVAFFPLYPLLVKILYQFLNNNVHLSGLLISNLSFLAGLVLLYRLTLDLYDSPETARRSVIYLAVFPATVFFSAIYTEGLFFFLIIGCVYFARWRKWLLSGLFGMAASATRNLGVLVFIWYLWEWLDALGWTIKKPFALPGMSTIRQEIQGLIGLFMIPLGLLGYMTFLGWMFNDPLAFIHTQKGWHETIPGPIQVYATLFRELSNNPQDPVLVMEFFYFLLFAAYLLSIPSIVRRFGLGAAIFCVAYVLIPSSATLISLPRYIASMFPFVVVLAELGKRRWLDETLRVVFTALMAVFTAVFVNWRFFF